MVLFQKRKHKSPQTLPVMNLQYHVSMPQASSQMFLICISSAGSLVTIFKLYSMQQEKHY